MKTSGEKIKQRRIDKKNLKLSKFCIQQIKLRNMLRKKAKETNDEEKTFNPADNLKPKKGRPEIELPD